VKQNKNLCFFLLLFNFKKQQSKLFVISNICDFVICDKLLIIYKVKQLVKSLSLFQVIVDAVGFIVIRKGVFFNYNGCL
jgi:hypothetical protein